MRTSLRCGRPYVFYQSPASEDWGKYDVRADVNLGSRDNVFWRISQHTTNVPAPLNLPAPAYGGAAFDSSTDATNTGFTWNHIWSGNLIMSVRGGWNYSFFERANPAEAGDELLNRKYGIKGGNDTLPGGLSQMNITGYRALGIGPNNPVARDSQNRQLTGDLSWNRGRHAIRFGGNILRSQNNIYNIRQEVGGPYQFNGRYTKDGMADFLLGMSSQFVWNSRLQVNLRMWNNAAFVHIIHFNVTAHRTAEWTAQQLREAFPFDQIPRYLLRDRDSIFGREFRKEVTAMGIQEVLSTPRSPCSAPTWSG